MLATLVRISIWRANPQDLPASHAWLGVALVAHVGADVLSLADTLSLRDALDAAMLDTALLAILTGLLLGWRGMSVRLPQTLIALAGTSVLLSLLAYPLHKLVVPESAASLAVSLCFIAWFVAMYAHVLKHALSVSTLTGSCLALLYVFASLVVSGMYLSPMPEA